MINLKFYNLQVAPFTEYQIQFTCFFSTYDCQKVFRNQNA